MVVGVDYSEGSRSAVLEARRLAARLGMGLRFVHVVEEGVQELPPVEIGAWLGASGVEQSAIEVHRGVAWIELAGVASEGSSLIVIGSHGRSGFQPLKPGRTATRLSLRSPIPVLIVPAGRRTLPGESPVAGCVEHVPEGFRRLERKAGVIREKR